LGAEFSTAGPTWQIGWTATRCSELTIFMADAGDQLAHIIRDLINTAVANGMGMGMGMGNLDRPNMTEQELFEYLRYDMELPVTRRMIKYAVMRREVLPTRLGNGNDFSKRDGLEWIRSRKR
jgi:hypothetical protein